MYIDVNYLINNTLIDEIKNAPPLKLQRLINYSESLINAYIGTTLQDNELKYFYLMGNNSSKINIYYPIVSLNKLVLNTTHNVNLNDVTINNSEIQLKADIFRDTDKIEIEAIVSIPDEIKLCVVLLCERYFASMEDITKLSALVSPFKSERIGNYSYELKNNTNVEKEDLSTGDIAIDRILDKYKKSDFYIEVI